MQDLVFKSFRCILKNRISESFGNLCFDFTIFFLSCSILQFFSCPVKFYNFFLSCPGPVPPTLPTILFSLHWLTDCICTCTCLFVEVTGQLRKVGSFCHVCFNDPTWVEAWQPTPLPAEPPHWVIVSFESSHSSEYEVICHHGVHLYFPNDWWCWVLIDHLHIALRERSILKSLAQYKICIVVVLCCSKMDRQGKLREYEMGKSLSHWSMFKVPH